MKKILFLLLSLFLIYFVIQIAFSFVGNGHSIEYRVDSFNIKEILTQNKKNEIDNYYFEIEKDGSIFNYQVFKDKQGSKLIKDIEYFKNTNYECIAVIFRNKYFENQVICNKDNMNYYYMGIKGNDPEVDMFAKDYITENNSSDDVLKQNGNLFVYNNLNEDYVAIEYYKGIYIINRENKYKKVALFKNETYNRDLAILVQKYYLTADYNSEYDFHKFVMVDLETGKKESLTFNANISFNSYFQGVVDGKAYLIDKDNKKQYEIDIKDKRVFEIGNEQSGIKIYKNNEFVDGNIYDAINSNIIFSLTDSIFNDVYSKVDLFGGSKSGLYFLFKQNGDKYSVYQSSVHNTNVITYLFDLVNINNLGYTKNGVYYINGNSIKYFDYIDGIVEIAKFNDLNYNSNLKLFVYEK